MTRSPYGYVGGNSLNGTERRRGLASLAARFSLESE
jgi:hypothetical protein